MSGDTDFVHKVIGLTYDQEPHGAYPVQAQFKLSDGRIGYYRARGSVTVSLWPEGTPSVMGFPPFDTDHEWVDLAPWVDVAGIGDPDVTPSAADPILRAWLADGAPTDLLATMRAERARADGLHKLLVDNAALMQARSDAWAVDRAALEASFLEARLEIAALRGEPEGAVGEGWKPERSAWGGWYWLRVTGGRRAFALDDGTWFISALPRPSGKAPSVRAAMRAADAWKPE